MQRLHPLDFTNHLLEKYPKQWHHLSLPALVENSDNSDSRAIGIPHNLNLGALWDFKYSKKVLEQEKIINPFKFS